MRIREFTINRFGSLAGQHVPRLADGITIILGDNEAGKSTCLNFFRAMLFGFSRSHKNPEFLTDKNGSGSLSLETDEYGPLRLFREYGKHGGTPVFTAPDGSPRPDADLDRIVRGCSVDLYDRVFAFSLSELTQAGSLSEDRIRHALYGAAFGTGLRSPGQVLKALDAEMQELFLARGAKPKINTLLRDLDAVNDVIKARGDEVARYAELAARLAEAASELAASGAERKALEEERRVLERTASLRQRWEDHREARDLLASLPEVPGTFTLDGRERVDLLAERTEERSRALRAAELALERAETEAASLAFDEALAGAAGRIFALAERKESVREASGRIGALWAEHDTLTRAATEVCADLGPAWNTETMLAADLSLAVFERCESLGQAVLAAEAALSQAGAEHERAGREKAAAETALEETRGELRAIGLAFGGEGALVGESAIADAEDFERRAERLGNALAKAGEAAENIGALAAAARNAEQAYDAAVAAVHSSWVREDFERVALSPADRERMLALARKVTECETHAAEEERECKTAERDHAEASFRAAGARESLARRLADPAMPHPAIAEAKAALDRARGIVRRVQAEFAVVEKASAAYASINEQFGDITNLVRVANPRSAFPWPLLVLFFAVLGLVCGGGLYFFDLGAPAHIRQHGLTALVSGGAFLVAWLALFARGGDGSAEAVAKSRDVIEERLVKKRDEAEKAGKAAEEAIAERVRDVPEIFPGGIVSGASLAEAGDLLARWRDACAAAEREHESLHRENALLAGAARRLESAENALETARAALARANETWREALEAFHLPLTVPASDARFLLERLETASIRRSAYLGRAADMQTALERIAACLREAKRIPDLAGMLASLPEPESHFAPEHGPWLAVVRDYLASWKSSGRERVRLRDLAALRAARLGEAVSRHAAAQAALGEAESARGNATAVWRSWLDAHALPPALSPETARRALDAASRAKTALAAAKRLREQAEALVAERDAFVADVAAFAEFFPEKTVPEGVGVSEALALLDSLVERARSNSGKAAVAAARERELPALRDAVTIAEEHLAAAREEMREILTLAGCENREVFRAAHGKWRERETAAAAERSMRVSLEREAADARIPLAELAASFAGGGGDNIAQKLADLDAKLGAALAAEREIAETKGKLDAAMSGLLNEKGLTELLTKRESIAGEIESLAREWTRLAAARELLLAAKRRFESERQHGVAKYASDLFRDITNGAYGGISVSLDGEGVFAVAKDGSVKDPQSELSRGTREQLYLALRLAYIMNHGKEAEKLPVVMDDILVNFDAKRAANTARVLSSFAADHQILFFTCHRQTADTLRRASADAALYLLENGVFAEG